jgi:hypothetical protein
MMVEMHMLPASKRKKTEDAVDIADDIVVTS